MVRRAVEYLFQMELGFPDVYTIEDVAVDFVFCVCIYAAYLWGGL